MIEHYILFEKTITFRITDHHDCCTIEGQGISMNPMYCDSFQMTWDVRYIIDFRRMKGRVENDIFCTGHIKQCIFDWLLGFDIRVTNFCYKLDVCVW